jgi:hypothetical protein
MSTLRRLATATASVAGVLLATLALTTTPAYAEDAVQVDLNGVSGNMTAGARLPSTLTGTYTNKSGNAITNIRVIFTIQLDGLAPDGVRMQRLDAFGADLASESAGDGMVRIIDPLPFELGKGSRKQTRYLMLFTSSAPSGKASITLELYAGSTRLGSDSASTTVRGSTAPSPTKSTPPNTNPGIVPTFEAGPSYSLAPLPQGTDLTGTDVPPSLYVLGGLLVTLGGVIMFLLFRRQRGAALVEYPATYEEVRPPSLGYPSATGPMRPTAVLPTVRGPEPPRRPRP